jgi:outer membrane protein OmpA-like peptidoglycan-associated protein
VFNNVTKINDTRTIRPRERAALWLNNNPDYKPIIIGSANDNIKTQNGGNQQLSSDRANATASALEDRNIGDISPDDILARGSSTSLQGRTTQGTKELNRNAQINFVVPLRNN